MNVVTEYEKYLQKINTSGVVTVHLAKQDRMIGLIGNDSSNLRTTKN